jgi:hypothetical protein
VSGRQHGRAASKRHRQGLMEEFSNGHAPGELLLKKNREAADTLYGRKLLRSRCRVPLLKTGHHHPLKVGYLTTGISSLLDMTPQHPGLPFSSSARLANAHEEAFTGNRLFCTAAKQFPSPHNSVSNYCSVPASTAFQCDCS